MLSAIGIVFAVFFANIAWSIFTIAMGWEPDKDDPFMIKDPVKPDDEP